MGWINPTGNSETLWINPSNAYDDSLATYANGKDTESLELTLTPTSCSKVRMYANVPLGGTVSFKLEAYYNGAYHTIWDDAIFTQDSSALYVPDAWFEIPLAGIQTVSKLRITSNVAIVGINLYEIQLYEYSDTFTTISEIKFDGSVGGTITDENGETITKNAVPPNTIDMDGSGNGVFTANDTAGINCYITEPIVASTDLLGANFKITFNDIFNSVGSDYGIIYFFGDFSTKNGALFYTDDSWVVYGEFINNVVQYYRLYYVPIGLDTTSPHDIVISRICGEISFSIDGEPLCIRGKLRTYSFTDSFVGTGNIYVGFLQDDPYTTTIGNFKIEKGAKGIVRGRQINLNDCGNYLNIIGLGELFTTNTTPYTGGNVAITGMLITGQATKESCCWRYVLDSTIPKGSTITSAIIKLKEVIPGMPSTGAVCQIRCQKASAPAAFTEGGLADYLSRRGQLTTAHIDYTREQVADTEVEIDITDLLNEIVADYDLSNVAVFMDDEAGASTDDNVFAWYNHDGTGDDYISTILISYEEGTPPTPSGSGGAGVFIIRRIFQRGLF
jgi:hypothetical protein